MGPGIGQRASAQAATLLIVLVVIGLSEISLWIIAREKGLQRSLMRFIISADVPISTYPLQMRLLLLNSELSEMPRKMRPCLIFLARSETEKTDEMPPRRVVRVPRFRPWLVTGTRVDVRNLKVRSPCGQISLPAT